MANKYFDAFRNLYEKGVFTEDHLRTLVQMTEAERNGLLRKKVSASTSKSFTEFGECVIVGTIKIPKDAVVKECLEHFFKNVALDSTHLMDSKDPSQMCKPGMYKPGQRFKVKLYPILRKTTTEHCVRFLQDEHARPLGAFGLTLVHSLELPKDVRLLSFLSYEVGERLAGLIKHDANGRDSVIRPHYGGVRTKGDQLIGFIPV